MARDKLTEYDQTAANNTVIGDVNTSETMLPSEVNDALREQMSHLADFAAGTQPITKLATASIDANGGTIKLDGNYPVGTGNVALGDTALDDGSLSGDYNTALGSSALTSNTSGGLNVAIGTSACFANTTGSSNTSVGFQSLVSNTTANYNTAVGYQAGYSTTTGGYNTLLGYRAGHLGVTSPANTIIGFRAGENNTSSTGYNVFVGNYTGYSNTSGHSNCFIGARSGGLAAGYYVTTGSKNTIIGGYSGNQGGLDIRTSSNYIVLSDGSGNPKVIVDNSGRLLVGTTVQTTSSTQSGEVSSAGAVGFMFSQTSTAANYAISVKNNQTYVSGTRGLINFYTGAGGGAARGSITVNASDVVVYNTTSDYRLKTDVQPITNATERLKLLNPVNFEWIDKGGARSDGFIAHEVQDIVADAVTGTKDAVDADGNPEYQGIDQSKLVPLLTAALQEALTKIDQLETRIEALEAN